MRRKIMTDDILIRAEHVSKKFCRSLRKSLWHGVQDSVKDLCGVGGTSERLRADEFWAVNDVSFQVRRGECLGLIGHNGAGKTTLLKMLNGLIKPDNGRIEMRGRVSALIALGAGFNPVLSGRENIYVNGSVLGLSKKEIDQKYEEIVDFADIGEFIDAPVQSYSSGMAVRLGFAVAVAVEPDILLLDEVLAVGDISFQAKCYNTLAAFRQRGTAFILVSHNMHMISRYCQDLLYMRQGHVEHSGDVPTGISKFIRDGELAKDNANAMDGAALEWSSAVGSGKLKVIEATFLDSQRQPISEIAVGEPVTLVLHYKRNDPRIKEAILDVIVRDQEGVVYQGNNLLSGWPLKNFLDCGQLRLEFGYLPVNVSYLDFFFALLDGATGEVHDWKRNVRLNVRRSGNHQGRLVLPTKWTMMPLDRQQINERNQANG
jgi:lipopolysaccharide transport system ATP-binding protein